MKLFVVLCFVAVACAAPPAPYQGAEIEHYDNDNTGTGSYQYSVKQSDGTEQQVTGEFLNNQAFKVKGFYSWNAPDGYKYTVKYVSDVEGYHSTLEKSPYA